MYGKIKIRLNSCCYYITLLFKGTIYISLLLKISIKLCNNIEHAITMDYPTSKPFIPAYILIL